MTSSSTAGVATAFYRAFAAHDADGMVALYHPQATFCDPVFGTLDAAHTAAMWRMLLGRAPEMQVRFKLRPGRGPDEQAVRGRWEAHYTFSQTGRPVHNVVETQMTVHDGLIFRHADHFDVWAWSRQALGLRGLLLGWSLPLHRRVSRTALENLQSYMAQQPVRPGAPSRPAAHSAPAPR